MPRFLIELYLDGYDTQAEMIEACEEFIYDSLNMTASSVEVLEVYPDPEEEF